MRRAHDQTDDPLEPRGNLMRLCRFEQHGRARIGFYNDDSIVPLSLAARRLSVRVPDSDCILSFLTGGSSRSAALELQRRLDRLSQDERAAIAVPATSCSLLVPVPAP